MKSNQQGSALLAGIVVIVILAIIFVPLIISLVGIHYETGRGEHTGFVTAVERSGIIWKTGTAYIKTDISSSQEDTYCIIDPAVYSRLEELSKEQAKVTIQHKSYLAAGITNCGGESAIIYSIK